MTTQELVYTDAQAACGLKVGDWVKIVDADLYANCGWDGIWSYEKQATIGKTGRIISMTDHNITVSGRELGGAFDYPYFMLQKVEKQEHKFKPFDKVLVRDSKKGYWRCAFYSHRDNAAFYHCAGKDNWWQYCIPYEGNEHLVGTTDNPE